MYIMNVISRNGIRNIIYLNKYFTNSTWTLHAKNAPTVHGKYKPILDDNLGNSGWISKISKLVDNGSRSDKPKLSGKINDLYNDKPKPLKFHASCNLCATFDNLLYRWIINRWYSRIGSNLDGPC